MTQITELELKRLAPGARITDEAIEGFVARRLPSGKVSFGYQYTDKANVDRLTKARSSAPAAKLRVVNGWGAEVYY
jgi:hypothetical protein